MRKRRFLALLGILAFATFFIGHSKAEAINYADFKPGRIIDDVVFTNKSSMSVSQIQAFLNSKVPVCETRKLASFTGGSGTIYYAPFTCLKDYQENFTSGVNNYGKYASDNVTPLPVTDGVTAAQIIWQVAQDYNINPQVLITLLEKEQGLISDTWPILPQYIKATGYLCPDTAPCSASAAGFYKQVSGAGWQLRNDFNGIDTVGFKSTYGKGWNNILYSPDISCGTRMVNIENQATAVLYKYTPYTPNDAAIIAAPNLEVPCGAYGNRNFWRLFNSWFGLSISFNNSPYVWELVSIKSYSNKDNLPQFSADPVVSKDEVFLVQIKAKNTGYNAWFKDKTRLGTSIPRDRSSNFYHPEWISASRPASLTESLILPGQIGTFEFKLKAPNSVGEYREILNILIEGVAWLDDEGLIINFQVQDTPRDIQSSKNILSSGGILRYLDMLLANSLSTTLSLDPGGQVVLRTNYRTTWKSQSGGGVGSYLIMQNDGNLVLYDSKSRPVWNTKTHGNPGAYFRVQNDGNLVLYSAYGYPLWSTYTVSHPSNNLLYTNTYAVQTLIYPGQSLNSMNSVYRLVLQKDGNLVLYKHSRALWASYTQNNDVAFVAMQGDGNLVIYNKMMQPIWNTSTFGEKSILRLQNDGNLVIYNKMMQPIWNTSTHTL